MSKYTVVLSKNAQKQLDKFTDDIAQPILDAIDNLKNDPRPTGVKKLKARDGYRVRVGNYRIIYEIIDNELIVDVVAVGHRKDIYD
jgi:mRNA interferase RelE/StbE